jgi:hypothetical protein
MTVQVPGNWKILEASFFKRFISHTNLNNVASAFVVKQVSVCLMTFGTYSPSPNLLLLLDVFLRPIMTTAYNPHRLKPGVYQLFNNVSNTVLDLAAYEFKYTVGPYVELQFLGSVTQLIA